MSGTGCGVLVVGLDGASPDLIARWTAEGDLPNLARLMREGAWGKLRSTLPPVTAPAWVSFMTGKNPGRHGVFNFRNMDLRSYSGVGDRASVASSAAFPGQSVFEIVSAAAGRVASINMPATYPVFPVNGVLIAGLPLLPDMRRAYTWPPELASELGPWSRNSETLEQLSNDERLAAVDFWTTKHTAVSLGYLAEGPWDLFAMVLRNTDAVPHYFWKYFDPSYHAHVPDERYRGAIREHYRKADEALGQLVAAGAGEETLILVVSDHGMGSHPGRCFHVNRWLSELDLLTPKASASRPGQSAALHRLKERVPRRWRLAMRSMLPAVAQERFFRALLNVGQIDWSRTQAYRVPLFPMVDGIEINLRGRQPEGNVEPGRDYEILRDRLIGELRGVRDPETGAPIVEEAWRREDVYAGPYTEDAPDILVLYRAEYTGGAALHGPLLSPYDESLNHWSGTHRMDGVIVAHGPTVRANAKIEGARIIDVAPTILSALGLPVPGDMDGRVLPEIVGDRVAARPPEDGQRREAGVARVSLTPEEEKQITAHLRGLGYV
jgi:predicted AlkP superfamily phosphohydrolase/phosphomutase